MVEANVVTPQGNCSATAQQTRCDRLTRPGGQERAGGQRLGI